MKTIGLIGGMSWESSLEYYRIINQAVKEKLGEPHSCQSIMYSVNFADYEKMQESGEWEKIGNKLVNIAQHLEKAGAEILLICANTMHKVAPEIQENINIPLLHIADAAAAEIKKYGMEKVGLLGTRYTMEQAFYKERIKEKHGINVIIPDKTARNIIQNVIYDELISGIIKEDSRVEFLEIIKDLQSKGAEGIILGCTEIPLLIKNSDSEIPIFNTTELHAKMAVEMVLNGDKNE